MSRLVLLICLVLFGGTQIGLSQSYEAGLRRASVDIISRMERSGQRTGTVLDFTDLQKQGNELGRFLAQELSDQLVEAAKTITFVDRAHLEYLLRENKLSAEGLTNPETSGKLGKLIGIDTVIDGTVTVFGNDVRLRIRAIAVETGKIVAATSLSFPASEELVKLYPHGVGGGGEAGVRDRIRAESFKLKPSMLIANVNVGTKLSFSIENRSGVAVGIGLRSRRVSAGPCIGVNVTGLEAIDDAKLRNLKSSREPEKLMTWLPVQGTASATIDFGAYQCPPLLSGVSTVPFAITLVVGSGKDVVELPLSAEVPVRLVGN